MFTTEIIIAQPMTHALDPGALRPVWGIGLFCWNVAPVFPVSSPCMSADVLAYT